MVRSLTALASLAFISLLAAFVQFQNKVGITVVSYSDVREVLKSPQNASAVGPVSEPSHDPTSKLSQWSRLEFQAHKLFEEKRNVPLQELPTSNSNTKKVHYRIWPHSLSPGFPAHLSFKLQNRHNSEEKWTPMSCIRRVICKADHQTRVPHFAHFAEAAFPCWSALQHYTNMPNVETFMEVPRYALKDNSSWYYQFLQGVQESGIAVSKQGKRHASSLPKLTASDITTNTTSNIKPESCEWMATFDIASSFPLYNYKDSQRFPVPSCRYFEKQEHMELLQQTILKNDFVPTSNRSNNELNVLILNREGSTRHWVHAEETRDLLNQEWNIGSVNQTEQLLNTTIRPSFSGLTFFQQALEIHRADIIVSPHGAQLTNLAFIQPCTAVIELFPQHYFLGFFQSYVIAGKGISMNGYPMDREPIEDTRRVTTDRGVRGSARSGPMLASPESLALAIPGIVLEVLSCRRRQSMFSGMTESRHQV